uniref:Uncharacterized protein n=1 Tax=Arundo donax TaxID=35708 RepID=A0A0A8YWG4_ARUDO
MLMRLILTLKTLQWMWLPPPYLLMLLRTVPVNIMALGLMLILVRKSVRLQPIR